MEKFCPSLRTVRFHGARAERNRIKEVCFYGCSRVLIIDDVVVLIAVVAVVAVVVLLIAVSIAVVAVYRRFYLLWSPVIVSIVVLVSIDSSSINSSS